MHEFAWETGCTMLGVGFLFGVDSNSGQLLGCKRWHVRYSAEPIVKSVWFAGNGIGIHNSQNRKLEISSTQIRKFKTESTKPEITKSETGKEIPKSEKKFRTGRKIGRTSEREGEKEITGMRYRREKPIRKSQTVVGDERKKMQVVVGDERKKTNSGIEQKDSRQL
ncbi:hypothetical protein LXL04_005368 [Taraxacum kok-saghyz]